MVLLATVLFAPFRASAVDNLALHPMTNPILPRLRGFLVNENELIIVNVGDNKFLVGVPGAVNVYEKKENGYLPILEKRDLHLNFNTALNILYPRQTVAYSRFNSDDKLLLDEIALSILRVEPLTVIDPELLMKQSQPGKLWTSMIVPFPEWWLVKQYIGICIQALSSKLTK